MPILPFICKVKLDSFLAVKQKQIANYLKVCHFCFRNSIMGLVTLQTIMGGGTTQYYNSNSLEA
jgi:hypothetical protein